jgi:hypothetical protein
MIARDGVDAKQHIATALIMSAELPDGLSKTLQQLTDLFDAMTTPIDPSDTADEHQHERGGAYEKGTGKQLPGAQPHIVKWIYESVTDASQQYTGRMQRHLNCANPIANATAVGTSSGTGSGSEQNGESSKAHLTSSRGHPLLLWLDVVLRALMLRGHCQAIRYDAKLEIVYH